MSIEWLTLTEETPAQIKPLSEVVKLWDSKACAWSTGNLIEPNHVGLVRKSVGPLIENLTPEARIFELASGANNQRYYPARFNFGRVIAADISPKMLRYLRPKCLGIKTVLADAGDTLPFKDQTFDLALCFFGMRYFENQEEVVNELLRVVKPGCHIGIADYDNYIYEGAVCAFSSRRLLEFVGSLGQTAFIHRLANPSCKVNPGLDFLEIIKAEKKDFV